MTEIVYKKHNSKKAEINQHEKDLAKKLGGRRQPNSGAIGGYKGDIKLKNFLIDSKETEGAVISVNSKDLTKITREAYEDGKEPALVITIDKTPISTESEWAVIPLSVFSYMLERGQDD